MSESNALPMAFLVFANDVTPAERNAYESWHGEHHVPQRLTVNGILRATRYKALGKGSPEYLTLYHLRALEVLDSAPYRALVDEPDKMTLAMRPHIRAPLRFACRTIVGGKFAAYQQTGNGEFLTGGIFRGKTSVDVKRQLSVFLKGNGLPFLVGRTDGIAGGHPVFQQREDAEVLCVLSTADEQSRLDSLRTVLSERWDFSLLPAMQRIAVACA